MSSPATQLGEGEKNHSFFLEVSSEQGADQPSFDSSSQPPWCLGDDKEHLILQSTLNFSWDLDRLGKIYM